MAQTPAKAKLVEIKAGQPAGPPVEVQFNPETLKVSYANQTVPQNNAGTEAKNDKVQVPGVATSKLSLTLFFDLTGELPPTDAGAADVRDLTRKVARFMTLQETGEGKGKLAPPKVRFEWGTFRFEGVMDALDESLEFFSADGRPLRATLGVSIQGTEVLRKEGGAGPAFPPGAPAGPGGGPPGTRPLTPAPEGVSLQQLAAGVGVKWQDVAAANGIENPRLLRTGQPIDLNVQASASVRFG